MNKIVEKVEVLDVEENVEQEMNKMLDEKTEEEKEEIKKKKRKKIINLIKYTTLTLISLYLFYKCGVQAYNARRYFAFGGEWLVLLIPFVYWLFEKTLTDTIKDFCAVLKQEIEEQTEENEEDVHM